MSTEHTNGDGDYTSSLLGILVMQDVHLGLLVALLPALAGRRGVAPAKANSGAVHSLLSGHDNANPGTKYLTCALISGPTTKESNTYFFFCYFKASSSVSHWQSVLFIRWVCEHLVDAVGSYAFLHWSDVSVFRCF